MSLRHSIAPAAAIALALTLGAGLAGCANAGLSFTQTRTEGYSIPEDALQQIRPGVSRDFVEIVLGSPQTTNALSNELAWYYIETKVAETAFGASKPVERTVLAVYFDSNNRVTDKAVYTLQDGKVFATVPRRTPGYGDDQTFVAAILKSVSGINIF